MNESKPKKPIYKRWWFWVIAVIVLLVITSSGSDGANDSDTSDNQTQGQTDETDFDQLAMDRFNEILAVSPELASIECKDNDCDSGFVYFTYKTTPPDDMEVVIRGNASTFSVFKGNNTSTTNVMVTARFNGMDIFWCTASKGMVTECSE